MKRLWWTMSLAACVLSLVCTPRVPQQVKVAPDFLPDTLLTGPHPWTKPITENEQEFRFAIVSDNNGDSRPGVFNNAMRKLNLLQPDFVMCVGDLISGYSFDSLDVQKQWNEMEKTIGLLERPFFHVPGNHDITTAIMGKVWTGTFNRPYYHFIYKNVLFLCLNTEDVKNAMLSDQQVDYFRTVLAQNPKVRWTFVFMHNPLWDNKDQVGWDKLEPLLAGRQYTVFAGHYHDYIRTIRNGQRYFILATTGGGSDLKGPAAGTFDHIVWVSVDTTAPRVSNLMLDGIYDEDVLSEYRWRQVLQTANRGALLQVPSLVPPDTFLQSTRVPFTLSNPDSAPITLSLAFRPNDKIKIVPERIRETLGPGTVKIDTVGLELDKPADLKTVPPIEFDWTVALAGDEQKFNNEYHSGLVAVHPYFCPPHQGPVKIDGKLDEWKDLPQVNPDTADGSRVDGSANWHGKNDAAYRFAMEYDDSLLYFAAEVLDDTLFFDTTLQDWQQDGLELNFGAAAEPMRSISRSGTWYVFATPGKTPGAMGFFPEKAPLIKGAILTTAKGYNVELAIPLNAINSVQRKPWEAIRLNICQFDYDTLPKSYTQLWWQPSWMFNGNVPGSGTFFKK